MKTNVAITLDDEQRKRLAQLLGNNRLSKSPLATREEINLVVHKCMQALLRAPESRDPNRSNVTPTQGGDWFDEYLAETCNGAVFGG